MRLNSNAALSTAVALLAVVVTATRSHAAEPAALAEGEIVLRVVDTAGIPKAGAKVRIFVYANEAWCTTGMPPDATTDKSGVAGFHHLDAKALGYFIRATTQDGLTAYKGFLLRGEPRRTVDLVVAKPIAAVLHIRDESGKPVEGASIWIVSHDGANGSMRLVPQGLRALGLTSNNSDTSGKLVLPELPGGKVGAKLIHPDFVPVEVSNVNIQENADADVVMRPGVKLSLKIKSDGPTDVAKSVQIELWHEGDDSPSSLDGPLPGLNSDGTARFTVAAGKYTRLHLSHPDFIVTPRYQQLPGKRLSDGAELFELKSGGDRFTFTLHKKIRVHGRIVDEAIGKPVPDIRILGEVPSQAEDSPLARFARGWTQADFAYTDDHGEYTIALAAGQARLTVQTYGYASRSYRNQVTVATDGSTVVPDIKIRPLPKVRGVVLDEVGKPVADAIVRFRGSLLTYAAQTTVSDASGSFELSLPFIPIDLPTDEQELTQTLVAFHPFKPISGEASVRLEESAGIDNVQLTLKPQDFRSIITGYPDELTPKALGILPADEKSRLAAISLVGKPAPELDGAVWLNTDKPKPSLADFRGKYVLLQFWTTWCGPCHRDMPNVKLLDRLYKDKGLVVIGIHDNSSPLDEIKNDVAKQGLTYPIVVDQPDNRILSSYQDHGISGYPSYVLIGPNGKVMQDDETVAAPNLRNFKLEIVREILMSDRSKH